MNLLSITSVRDNFLEIIAAGKLLEAPTTDCTTFVTNMQGRLFLRRQGWGPILVALNWARDSLLFEDKEAEELKSVIEKTKVAYDFYSNKAGVEHENYNAYTRTVVARPDLTIQAYNKQFLNDFAEAFKPLLKLRSTTSQVYEKIRQVFEGVFSSIGCLDNILDGLEIIFRDQIILDFETKTKIKIPWNEFRNFLLDPDPKTERYREIDIWLETIYNPRTSTWISPDERRENQHKISKKLTKILFLIWRNCEIEDVRERDNLTIEQYYLYYFFICRLEIFGKTFELGRETFKNSIDPGENESIVKAQSLLSWAINALGESHRGAIPVRNFAVIAPYGRSFIVENLIYENVSNWFPNLIFEFFERDMLPFDFDTSECLPTFFGVSLDGIIKTTKPLNYKELNEVYNFHKLDHMVWLAANRNFETYRQMYHDAGIEKTSLGRVFINYCLNRFKDIECFVEGTQELVRRLRVKVELPPEGDKFLIIAHPSTDPGERLSESLMYLYFWAKYGWKYFPGLKFDLPNSLLSEGEFFKTIKTWPEVAAYPEEIFINFKQLKNLKVESSSQNVRSHGFNWFSPNVAAPVDIQDNLAPFGTLMGNLNAREVSLHRSRLQHSAVTTAAAFPHVLDPLAKLRGNTEVQALIIDLNNMLEAEDQRRRRDN